MIFRADRQSSPAPFAVCRGRRHPYDDHLYPGACDGASVPVLKSVPCKLTKFQVAARRADSLAVVLSFVSRDSLVSHLGQLSPLPAVVIQEP